MAKRKYASRRKFPGSRKRLRTIRRAWRKRIRRGAFRQSNYLRVVRETTPVIRTITASLSSVIDGQLVKLTDIPDYADYLPLFDAYKITKAILYIRMVTNPDGAVVPNSATTNQNTWFLDVAATADDDDNTAAFNWQDLQQYAKVKTRILKPGQWFRYPFRPALQIQTYRTATSTGYIPKRNQWVDLGQPEVPHYGVKWIVQSPGSGALTQTCSIEIKLKIFAVFKNSR